MLPRMLPGSGHDSTQGESMRMIRLGFRIDKIVFKRQQCDRVCREHFPIAPEAYNSTQTMIIHGRSHRRFAFRLYIRRESFLKKTLVSSAKYPLLDEEALR